MNDSGVRMATRSSRLGCLAALAAIAACAAPAFAARLDLSTPGGALAASRKMQCSLEDGRAVFYWWTGDMYSRVPGDRDRLLFRVEGMNVRQCDTLDDPQRGKGYRYVSREILLYEDPVTGVALKTWHNPWTGEDVEVVHVANDPVNAREPNFPVSKDGTSRKWTGHILGNYWWMTDTIPLFYDNPLQGGYQDYVGGKYHAVEMFNTFGDVDDLVGDKTTTARVHIGWVRISGWLPWMRMGDRPGEVYFHAAGEKLAGWEDLPATLRDEILRNYPAWRSPPPLDDPRPNETSWSYFKKKVPPRSEAAH